MALLEVSGLCAGYGQVQVLRDVDFTVDDGEMVVLLGANGAGKTTTLRALCQMIDTWGSVRFDGVAVRRPRILCWPRHHGDVVVAFLPGQLDAIALLA